MEGKKEGVSRRRAEASEGFIHQMSKCSRAVFNTQTGERNGMRTRIYHGGLSVGRGVGVGDVRVLREERW